MNNSLKDIINIILDSAPSKTILLYDKQTFSSNEYELYVILEDSEPNPKKAIGRIYEALRNSQSDKNIEVLASFQDEFDLRALNPNSIEHLFAKSGIPIHQNP